MGWGWGTDGQSESSKTWTPLPTCHTAAACSPECGSWWMAACGCRPPSLMMRAATPVYPAMAFHAHPRPLPTSLFSVSLTPAPSPDCSPPLGQAKLLPDNLSLLPPRPRPGDCHAS